MSDPLPGRPSAGSEGDDSLAPLTFEQLMEELEATIARMAGGQLGIEEVTELYERAGRLHAAARDRLAAVQARIEKLTGERATGG